MVKTNRSTLHTVNNIQQSAMQGSNNRIQTVTQDSSNNYVMMMMMMMMMIAC